MANLIQTRLYFCLRSCEYTKISSHRRIVQFHYKDMQFHDQQSSILHNAPDSEFFDTWADTLFVDIQKNSVQGEYSTMEATGVPDGDPVVAAAHMYLHLRSHDACPNTPICIYFTYTIPHSVNSRPITALLRLDATKIGCQTLVFKPRKNSIHSLRSGGSHDLPPY